MTITAPIAATGEIDNRAAYLSFGFAYVFGHGATALSRGANPLVSMPSWLPTLLLSTGFAVGTVYAAIAAARAQRGASKSDIRLGTLLALSWVSGFTALILAIVGLNATLNVPDLQTMLFPAGAGLVVGMIYLGEGAARRNVVHYALGTWLALISTTALLLGTSGLFWFLAIAGGGGYAVATVFERRRLAIR